MVFINNNKTKTNKISPELEINNTSLIFKSEAAIYDNGSEHVKVSPN